MFEKIFLARPFFFKSIHYFDLLKNRLFYPTCKFAMHCLGRSLMLKYIQNDAKMPVLMSFQVNAVSFGT